MRNAVTKLLTGIVLSTVVSATTAVTPAMADASEHCQESGYCLFDRPGFTGKKAVLPNVTGCRAVTSVGISTARSAARGFGDSKTLVLYSDTRCSHRITDVTKDRAGLEPPALSYSLLNLPS